MYVTITALHVRGRNVILLFELGTGVKESLAIIFWRWRRHRRSAVPLELCKMICMSHTKNTLTL
jgi:hypothetical protein